MQSRVWATALFVWFADGILSVLLSATLSPVHVRVVSAVDAPMIKFAAVIHRHGHRGVLFALAVGGRGGGRVGQSISWRVSECLGRGRPGRGLRLFCEVCWTNRLSSAVVESSWNC